MNWHFGTVALYSNIQDLSDAKAKWSQDVIDSDTSTEIYDAYHPYEEGRWNNPGNYTWLDFYFKLGRGLRPHDQFRIDVSGFGLESVTTCMSLFFGDGVFEVWETDWKLNKVIGAYGMVAVEPQYQMYPLDVEVIDNGLTIYGFTGNMPAELGNGNDTHAVIRCGKFKNPDT